MHSVLARIETRKLLSLAKILVGEVLHLDCSDCFFEPVPMWITFWASIAHWNSTLKLQHWTDIDLPRNFLTMVKDKTQIFPCPNPSLQPQSIRPGLHILNLMCCTDHHLSVKAFFFSKQSFQENSGYSFRVLPQTDDMRLLNMKCPHSTCYLFCLNKYPSFVFELLPFLHLSSWGKVEGGIIQNTLNTNEQRTEAE